MGVDVLKKYSIEIGIINNAAKELDAMEKEINSIAKDGKLVSSLNDEFKKVKETITGLQGEIAALGIKIGDNAQLDAMSQKFQTTADQISTSVTEISGKMVELEKAITAITSGDALGISDSIKKQFDEINQTIADFRKNYETAIQLIDALQNKGVNFDDLVESIKTGKIETKSGIESFRKEISKELKKMEKLGFFFRNDDFKKFQFIDLTSAEASISVIEGIIKRMRDAGINANEINKMFSSINSAGGALNIKYLRGYAKDLRETIGEIGLSDTKHDSIATKEIRFRYVLDENGKGTESMIKQVNSIIEKVKTAIKKNPIEIGIGYKYDDTEEEEKSEATTPEAKEKEIVKKLKLKTKIKKDEVFDQVKSAVNAVNKQLQKADAPKIELQVKAKIDDNSYDELADDVTNELKDRKISVDPTSGKIATSNLKLSDTNGIATEATLQQVLKAIQDCCAQGGAPGNGGNKEAIVTPEISEEAKRSASEELDRFLVESIFRLRRSGKYLSKEETGILKTREMLLGRLFTGQQEKGQLAQVIKAAKKGDLEALRQTDYYKGSVKVNGVEYAKYGKNGETLADWQKTVEEQFLRLSKAYTEAAQKAKDDFVKSQEQTAEDYLKAIYDSKTEEAKRLADEAVESYKEEQKIKGKTPTEQDIERERKRIYEQLEKEADQERQYKRSIYNRSEKPVKGWQAEIIDTFIELQKRLDKNDSAVRKNFEDRYRGEITELSKSTGDEFHVAASKLVSQKINEMIERVINSATPKDFTDTFTPTVIQNRTDKTGEQILASLQSNAMERAALPAIGEYTKELKGIMLQLKGTMERLAANGAEVKVEKGQARVLARQSTAVNVWEGQSEAQLQFNEINETAIERYRERQEILEALKEGEASLIEYKDLMAKKESGLSEEEEQRLKALEKELLTSAEVVNNKERQLQLQKEYAEITERLSRGKEAFHGSQKEYNEGVTRAQDIIREMSENIRPAQNSDELLEFVDSELNRIRRLESEQRGLIATTKETIRAIANNYGANEWRKEDEEELNGLVSSVTSLLETITGKNGIADRSLLTPQESRKLRSAEDRIKELRNKQSAYLALQVSESDKGLEDIFTGKSTPKVSGTTSPTVVPRITNLGLDKAMSVAYAQAEESIKNVASLTEEDLKKLREIYINALDQMQKDISDDDKKALRTGGEISPELKAKLNNMAKEILDSYIKNLQEELDEKIKTHAELQAKVNKATTPEEREAAQKFADSYKRRQIDTRQATVDQLTSETERISNSRVQGIIDRANKQKEIQEEIYKLLSEAGYKDEDIKEAHELMKLIQEREVASSRLKDTQILAYQFFSDKDKYLQFDEEGNLYLSEMTSEEKESEEKRKKLREDSIRYVQGEFDYVQELFEQADDALSKSIKEKEGSPVSPAMSQMLFKLMRGKEERVLGGKSNLLDVIEPKANEIMGILNEFDIDASKMSVTRLDRSSQILTDMAQKIQIEERQATATNDGSAESEAKIKELHNSWVALADAARKIEDLNPLENLFEVWVRERKTVDRLRNTAYAEPDGHAFGLDEEQESRLFDLTEQLKPTYRGRGANTFSLTTVSAIAKLQELRKKVKEYPENNKHKTNLENQIKELEDQLAKSGFFVDESGNVEARGARQSRLDAILDRLINNYVLRANQDDFITKRIQTIDQEIAKREEASHREANESAVDTIVGNIYGTGEEPTKKQTRKQKQAEIKTRYDDLQAKQDAIISEAEKTIEEEQKRIEKAKSEMQETLSPEMEDVTKYIHQLLQNDPEYTRIANIAQTFRHGNLPGDFTMSTTLEKKMQRIQERIVKEHESEIEALKQRNKQRRDNQDEIKRINAENQARQKEIEAAEVRIANAQEKIRKAKEMKEENEEIYTLESFPFSNVISSKMSKKKKKNIIDTYYSSILKLPKDVKKSVDSELTSLKFKKNRTNEDNQRLYQLENESVGLSKYIKRINDFWDDALKAIGFVSEKEKEVADKADLAAKNTEEAMKARREQAEAERKANEEHAQLVEKIDQERRNEAMRSHNGIGGKIANPYNTETNKHRKAIESLWRTAGMTDNQAGVAREIAQLIQKLKNAKGQIKTDLEAELKERQEYAKTLNLQINSHGYVQELVSYREYMENPFKWIKPEQVEAVMNRTRGSGKSSALDTEVTGLATESTLRKVLNAIENCCKNGGMGKRPKLKWGGIDTGVDGIKSYDKNLKEKANDLLKLDQGMINKETQEAVRKAIISGFGINRSKKSGVLYMGDKRKKSNYDKAETEKFIKEHNLKESIDKATAAINSNIEQQKRNSGYNNYGYERRRKGGQRNNTGGVAKGKATGIDGITAYNYELFKGANALLASDKKAANKATRDAIAKALISGYGIKRDKDGNLSMSSLKNANKTATNQFIKDNGLTDEIRKARATIEGYRKDKKVEVKNTDSSSDSSTNTGKRRRRKPKTKSNRSGISEEDIYSFEETYRTTDEKYKIDWKALGQLKGELNDVLKGETATPQQMEEAVKKGVEAGLIISKDDGTGNRILRSPALVYRRENGSFGGSVTPAEIQATRDYATANGIALTRGIAADTGYTIGMKAVNIEVPKADVKAADAKVETPKTEVETPSADVKTSEAKIETPSVNVEGKSLAQLNNIIARTKDENKRKAWIDAGESLGYTYDKDKGKLRLYNDTEIKQMEDSIAQLNADLEKLNNNPNPNLVEEAISITKSKIDIISKMLESARTRIAEASGTTEVHPAISAPEDTSEIIEKKAKADEHAAVATESLATAEEHLAKTAESATEAVKTEASSKKKSNGKEFTRADFEAMDDETLKGYYRRNYYGVHSEKSKWGTDAKTKWTGYLTEIEDIFKTRGIDPLDTLKKASDKAAKEVAELGDSADKAETKVKETTTPSSASDKPVSDTAPKSSGKGKSSGAYSGYALESTLQKVLAAIQECCKKGGMSGSGKNKSGSGGKGKTTAKTDPTVGNPYTTQETDVLIKKYAETLKKIGEAAYVEEADKLKKTLDALEQAILSKKNNLSDTDAFTNERLLSFWNMLNKPYNSGVIAKGTGLGQVYQNIVDELVNNRGFKLDKNGVLRKSIFDADEMKGVSRKEAAYLIGERNTKTGKFELNDFGKRIEQIAKELIVELKDVGNDFEISVKDLKNGITQYNFKTANGNAVLEYNDRTGQFSRGAGTNVTDPRISRQQTTLREYQKIEDRLKNSLYRIPEEAYSFYSDKYDIGELKRYMDEFRELIDNPEKIINFDYKELQERLQKLKDVYRDLNQEIKDGSIEKIGVLQNDGTSTRSQLEKMAYELSNGSVEIKKFNDKNRELTYTMKTADGMVKTFTLSVDGQTKEISKALVSEEKYVSGFSKFIDSLYGKGAELFRYVIANFSIYRVYGEIRQGLTVIREMDTAMTNLNKVSNDSSTALEHFRRASYDIASSIGSTGKAVVDAATEWARLGYNIEEASKLAQASSVYANVGEIDSATATTDLVSALKAFKIDSDNVMNVVDVLNEIGNNYAVSSAELGQVLEKSSSALAVSGDTLEQVVAMGAAMNEVIQDASVTGSTLKILSLRLRGTKTDIEEAGEETDGMAESTSKLREKILALTNVTGKGGFDIMADENTYKSTYEIVKGIAQVWEDMSQIDQAALLELIAGKNRAQGVSALISNFAKSEAALNDAMNASGSAMRENDKYMESINGHIAVMQNKYQQMWDTAINRDFVNFIIDAGSGVLDLVHDFGLLKTLVIGIIPAITTFNGAIGKMPQVMSAKNFGIGDAGRTSLSLFGVPIGGSKYRDLIDQFGANLESRKNTGLTDLDTGKAILVDDKEWGKIVDEEAKKLNIVNTELIEHAKRNKEATLTGKEYIAGLKQQGKGLDGLTPSVRAANIATGLLTTALNTLINVGISAFISGTIYLIEQWITADKRLADGARELGDKLNDNNRSVDEYKARIQELQNTINDSSSSINDVVAAREELYNIQDELIAKYGSEKDVVDSVTQAIYGQADALDYLKTKYYQDIIEEYDKENSKGIINWFRNLGDTRSTTERIRDRVENYAKGDMGTVGTRSINGSLTGDRDLQQYIVSNLKGVYDNGNGSITFGREYTDIYSYIDQLKQAVELAKQYEDETKTSGHQLLENLESELEKATSDAKQLGDAYYATVFNDKVLSDYLKENRTIENAFKTYKDAITSGSKDEIDKAGYELGTALNNGIQTAIDDGNRDVARYFEQLYPVLQNDVSKWRFKVAFETDENFRDKIKEELGKLGNVTYEDLLSNRSNTKNGSKGLFAIGEEKGLSRTQFADTLLQNGLLETESYRELGNLIGGAWKDVLANFTEEEQNFLKSQKGLVQQFKETDYEMRQQEIEKLKSQRQELMDKLSNDLTGAYDFVYKKDIEDLNKQIDAIENNIGFINYEGAGAVAIIQKIIAEANKVPVDHLADLKQYQTDIDKYISGMSAINTAMSEQANIGNLSASTVQSLTDAFGKENVELEKTRHGIMLNVDSMNQYVSTNLDKYVDTLNDKQKDLAKQYQGESIQLAFLNELLAQTSDSDKERIKAIQASIKAQEAQMNVTAGYMADIDALSYKLDQARNKFLLFKDAMSTENQGANFDYLQSNISNIEEIAKSGRFNTDEMRRFVDMYTTDEFDAMNATAKEVREHYEEAMKLAKKYTTENPAEGLLQLVKDIKKIDDGSVLFGEGGSFDIVNIDKVAQHLGMTGEALTIFIQKMQEYDDSVKLGLTQEDVEADLTSKIETTKQEIDSIKQEIDELTISEESTKKNKDRIDELKIQLAGLVDYLDETEDDLKMQVQLSIDKQQAIQDIRDLQEQINQLDDTSGVNDETVASLMQKQQELADKYDIDINAVVHAEEDEVSKKNIDMTTEQVQALADLLNSQYELKIQIPGSIETRLQNILNKIKKIKDESNNSNLTTSITNSGGTTNTSGSSKESGDGGGAMGIPRADGNGGNLVGELGREMVVDPHKGTWYTVGDNGAEFVDLPKDAIVFSHNKTEDLLKRGATNGRGIATGKSFASGNTDYTELYRFGNIDLRNRQKFWWDENTPSTVLGTQLESNGLQFAVSPLLQGSDGNPILLEPDTINWYVDELTSKSSVPDEILKLDHVGINDNGFWIHDLVAYVGDSLNTASYISKVMHEISDRFERATGGYGEGKSFANGKNNDLVGELGTELVVDTKNGTWRLVGQNGAEFTDINSSDIVYNAEQTKKILGRSYANGKAYTLEHDASGGNVEALLENAIISKSNSDNGDKAANNAKDIEKSTEETAENIGEIKNSVEWLDRAVSAIEKTNNRIKEEAEDENNSYAERVSMYQSLLASDQDMIEVQTKALKIRESEWERYRGLMTDTFGAEQSTEFIDKIQMGNATLEEWRDSMNDIAPDDDTASKWLTLINDAISAYDELTDVSDKLREVEKNAHENRMAELELEVAYQQNITDEIKSRIDEINDRIDFKNTIGALVTESDYKDLISGTDDEIKSLNSTIEDYKKQLNELDPDSTAYFAVEEKIRSIESEIRQCEKQQAEWNEEILDIPIKRIESYISVLKNVQQDLSNEVSRDGYLSDKETSTLNLNLYKNAREQFKKYADEHEKLQDKLQRYDYGSEKFEETQGKIQDCEDTMSGLIDSMRQYSDTILRIPLNKLEKLSNTLSRIKDSVDETNSEWELATNTVVATIDKEVDGINELIKAKEEEAEAAIKPLQDQLDLMEKQNAARQRQLQLEQSQFNLAKAQQEKTIQVIRNGAIVWEANEEAIRDANQGLQDAQQEMIKAGIQDQIDTINKEKDTYVEAKNEEIEALEKTKERWSTLSEEIEYANDKAKTSEIFGESSESWIEKVLHQNGKNDDELYNMTKANRKAMTNYSNELEQQIGDIGFVSEMMEQYITAFNNGEMTYEEVMAQYKSLMAQSKDGLEAQEKLAANLSFGGYDTLADSVSEGNKETNQQLIDFLSRFGYYNGRENVDDEKNGINSISTMLNQLNGLQEDSQKIIDEKYAEYLKNQENIGKNVEKIAKHLDDEDDDDDRDEWIDDKSDTGYGAHTSKNSGDRTGWVSEGFRPEHYAEGLANGSVGSGGDKEKFRALQALGLRKLAPDEIPAILHVGEGVVNPKQMSTLLDNVEKAAMNPVGLGAMNTAALPNVTISMGDLTLPNVRNGEEFAKSLQQNFNPIMNQYFSKVFQ